MGRLYGLNDLTAQSSVISGATYGPAGQLLSMTGANGAPSETRTYNSLLQMTQLQSGGLSIQYAYSATQNNGKITSETDVVSGEQIAYTYDSLNRLASATGSGWGQSYAYDGFGNLTNQTVTSGTAPALNVSYDPATNRQTGGECADAAGNLNAMSSVPACTYGYTYDFENRIVRKGTYYISNPDVAYSYARGNKRVWRGVWSSGTQTVDEITFWSVNGQKLVTYQLSVSGSSLVATATGTNQYFGGKLIKNAGGYVTPDRLGSIGKYFPWGQERPTATTNGTDKFATYFRDSETGLDYANNRYHQPGMGRFMTPDPDSASGGPSDPGSWNRYAYTRGDPINRADPGGTDDLPCPTFGLCFGPMGSEDLDALTNGGLPGSAKGKPLPALVPGSDEPSVQQVATKGCPDYVKNFFATAVPILQKMADALGTNIDFLLAQSALETGYLNGPLYDKKSNNLFGASDAQEVPLRYNTLQDSANAWMARWGKDVRGVQDATTYFQNLVDDRYNPHPGYVGSLVGMVTMAKNRRQACQ